MELLAEMISDLRNVIDFILWILSMRCGWAGWLRLV